MTAKMVNSTIYNMVNCTSITNKDKDPMAWLLTTQLASDEAKDLLYRLHCS